MGNSSNSSDRDWVFAMTMSHIGFDFPFAHEHMNGDIPFRADSTEASVIVKARKESLALTDVDNVG
jgi:hypothetical protein